MGGNQSGEQWLLTQGQNLEVWLLQATWKGTQTPERPLSGGACAHFAGARMEINLALTLLVL